jgi:succinoglycan biosynthesis transport protein ExoP
MSTLTRMSRGIPAPYEGGAVMPSPPPPSDTVDLLDAFRVLRRRKWLILTLVLIGTLGGTLYGLQRVPLYTARATVLIEPQRSQVVDVQAVLSGLTPDQATMLTQSRVLQSRNFQARVMEDLRLFDDPEFNAALRTETPNPLKQAIQASLDRLMALLPRDWLIAAGLAHEPVPVLESEAPRLTREGAIDTFASQLEVAADGYSYVLGINFTSPDPEKAAQIANRIAEVYVDDQLKSKLFATDRASIWLNERLDTLKEEVRKAEEAVERYRAQNNLVGTGGTGGVLLNDQELSDLNRELIISRSELAARQARLTQARLLRSGGGAVDTLADVMNAPVIMSLRQQEIDLLRQEAELKNLYGARHPRMQQLASEKANLEAKMNAEIGRVTTSLENDVAVAAARVRTIESQLGGMKSRTNENREAEVRLRELERQAQVARQLYESFLTRSKEVDEQHEIVEPDARLISMASPPGSPSTPGTRLFTAAGFAISFVLSALLALLLDRLDKGLRSAREVEAALGLQALALMPRLERLKRGQKPYQYLMEKPLSAFTESVRAIYMSLKLLNVDHPPKVVLVTSSLPEEGKTTVAISLATFAARSHKRVLLIDLDLRHPCVNRELGWSVTSGLVEYMLGERTLEEVIHRDLETGLDFLPIKAQTSNPTDILESLKLRELIEACREHYDFIVLDSAPLVSVTDSRLAALLADKTLFVIKWGDTVESAAQDGLQTLRDIGIDVAGAVLTQIDLRKHALYRYNDIGEYYSKTKNYYVN